ncbi:MAG: VCBS repeat-containing protein [Bacteroidota bacterium]
MNKKIIAFLSVLLACCYTHAQEKLFTLLEPKKTGVHFINEISESEGFNVLAYEYFFNGAGVAVGDLDNDGLEDLFFTANMKPNKLFKNLGKLTFKDISAQAGKGIEGRAGHWRTGVTMADVNNDGLLDIYICYSGKGEADTRRNELFINLGNMKFKEAAKEFGLDDPSFSTQAAFFDYDLDGDLDMFLLNHSTKKVDNLEFAKYRNEVDELAGCKMFENIGNKFIDVSNKVGISRSALTFGLGIVVADINLDGWPDLYVTNDYNEPDHLYINNKQKGFTDAADQALTHMSQFSMGTDIADFNNDGLPDIITLDMLPEDNKRQKLLQLQENYEIFELMQQQGLHRQYMRNMLHLNNGNGTFTEIGQLAGISKTDWSWTPILADFDNDGYKDLFITNGYLRDYTNKDFLKYWGDYKVKKAMDREPVQLMELIKAMPSTKIPNYIFRNNQQLGFTNEQMAWGIDRPAISSAAVAADLDKDGDLDLIINNINEEAFIYQNNTSNKNSNHFIQIKINNEKGSSLNGTKVLVHTKGLTQLQELNQNRGYLSSASTMLHFGLAGNEMIDSIKIIWPGGMKETINFKIKANQLLSYTYANSTLQDIHSPTESNAIFKKINSPIPYQHKSFNENDFKRQPLMLTMYSNTGPVMAKSDVNKDGLEDIFISGNTETPGKIWVQKKNGIFEAIPTLQIVNEEESAVSAAVFADFNNDAWPDLYVAKGGYSIWMPNTPALQDELFINDGKGSFINLSNQLPNVSASSKSCVRAADVDSDGDMDIFVGGRIIPGRYPVTPESYLLVNDGKGKFTRQRTSFDMIGMVTDAQWTDLNNDQKPDLILVGEWMPIMVYLNMGTGFEDATDVYFPNAPSGLWSSLLLNDFNHDGKMDLLAGNIGENTPFKFSAKEPGTLFYADFDGNGSIDPFFNFYIQGISYPYVSRDELNEQIYAMRKKFLSYAQYASATMNDIFSKEDLGKAIVLSANHQQTALFFQQDGKFSMQKNIPLQAQFAPNKIMVKEDIDDDGNPEILLLGNQTSNRLKMGAIQANRGHAFKINKDGFPAYIHQTKSGLNIEGDVKSALTLKVDGKRILLVGASDQPLQAYAY